MISPVKILAICSTVRFSTLLPALTITAMPSRATMVSVRPPEVSLFLQRPGAQADVRGAVDHSFNARAGTRGIIGDRHIVVVVISNCSFRLPITFSMEVEPLVATVPETVGRRVRTAAICCCRIGGFISLQPAVRARTAEAARMLMAFFMVLFHG